MTKFFKKNCANIEACNVFYIKGDLIAQCDTLILGKNNYIAFLNFTNRFNEPLLFEHLKNYSDGFNNSEWIACTKHPYYSLQMPLNINKIITNPETTNGSEEK